MSRLKSKVFSVNDRETIEDEVEESKGESKLQTDVHMDQFLSPDNIVSSAHGKQQQRSPDKRVGTAINVSNY